MQTFKGGPQTKKSRAKVSKAATLNPNPDVQESLQAASSSEIGCRLLNHAAVFGLRLNIFKP